MSSEDSNIVKPSARRLRVGITTRPMEKGVSGSGMHLYRLLQALTKLDHQLDLFFLHHTPKRLDIYQHGTPCRISRNPIFAAVQLRKLRLDVLHFTPLSVFSPLLAPASTRCATLHPDDELIIPECYPWFRRLHSRKLVGAYARRMDRIFTVSNTSRELILKEYGVEPDRIVLTSNAVDEKYQLLAESELTAVHQRYTGGRPFVLHVSNFSTRKNPWTILRALNIVMDRSDMGDLRCVIVGNGWSEDSEVKNFIRSRKMEGRILLTGFIPEGDLPKLFNLARVFVFPSLSEGFGMPNLEAMACGCPVITSDAFAIPEIVGNAAHILRNKRDYAELAESIVLLLNDASARMEMSQRGVNRAREFSWQSSAKVLCRTYHAMFAEANV